MSSKHKRKKEGKMKGIALEFLPSHVFKNLSLEKKIEFILNRVKENKIIILEGKLSDEEKKELIKAAMEHFNFKFKGIEMETIDFMPKTFFEKIKKGIVDFLSGGRSGFTIIGPASIVKSIKKDPNELLLYMNA